MYAAARRIASILALLFAAASVLLCVNQSSSAQATVSTGSIVGLVNDPSGAVIGEAKVTLTSVATGQVIDLTANSSGSFSSGALVPGNYRTRIAAKGFKSVEVPSTLLVGNTATVNVTLQIGNEEVIEVYSSTLQVNTEQATVQGILNTEQIENLPVNGRNFLDLAQLEPGVQIQEGSTFDPTKNGFSSISFGRSFSLVRLRWTCLPSLGPPVRLTLSRGLGRTPTTANCSAITEIAPSGLRI